MHSSIENIDPSKIAKILAYRESILKKKQGNNLESSNSNSKCDTPQNNQENLAQQVTESPRPIFEYNLEQIDENLPLTAEGWQTLDFQSPAELLCFFNPQLNSGEITLHK